MAYFLLLVQSLLCCFATAAAVCSETLCPLAWVFSTQRGNGVCDLPCNTVLCGLDSALVSPFVDFSTSDCYGACTAAFFSWALGDFDCQSYFGLETAECGWDAGDCGYCADGCKAYSGFESDLGNGECQQACNSLACAFDGGDCVSSRQGYCQSGCFQPMLEDQVCQMECFVAACGYDNGACEAFLCSAGCYPEKLGDGLCQSECYVEACAWDLTDCDCAPGCFPQLLANDHCDLSCSTLDCNWDGRLCVGSI